MSLEAPGALAPGPGLVGEGGQKRGEERLGDARREIPDRLAREGLGEGRDVEQLVAMMAERDRALSLGRPDAPQDRLQAEAVLVGGEHLEREVGAARGLFGPDPLKFFLNSASCSGVAAFTCRGRGFWIDQPIRRRASQPRWDETVSSPSSPASHCPTFRLVHSPPSGGGSARRTRSRSSRSGFSTLGARPLRWRRSPRAGTPSAL